jgi:hypothetical protein
MAGLELPARLAYVRPLCRFLLTVNVLALLLLPAMYGMEVSARHAMFATRYCEASLTSRALIRCRAEAA